ncbi:MAG TPA: TonB-dependent receptor [Balneolales bacterium]|nr:TonB-dependent receptor [Balneolales bacterium]
MNKINLYLYLRVSALFLILNISFFSLQAFAQNVADSLELNEIQIQATRIKEPVDYQPIQVTLIDSTALRQYSAQDLGSLLSNQTFAFVQSNGPGGLQSLSLRGYDARHTQVIWDGFDLNHPMVGTADLSLIPVSILSSVEVSPGNPGTSFGAGSSGGVIYLKTDDFINKAQLSTTVGSFGQDQQNVSVGTRDKNWKVTLLAGRKQANNDFPYYNIQENKTIKRQHNALNARHLLTNLEWEKKNHFLKTALWYNHQNNHIANAINFNSGKGVQKDNSVRWYGMYGGRKGQTHYQVKAYYSHYDLKYDDSSFGTHSRSVAQNYTVEAQGRHYFSRSFDLSGLVSIQELNVKTNNYDDREKRQLLSGLLNAIYEPVQGLRIYPAIRIDSYSDFGSQLSPALGVNYELMTNKLFLRAQIKQDFTAPTFNQLYWQPGGNPDLDPEKSRTLDIGLTYDTKFKQVLDIRIMPSYYVSKQKDGIRWMPNNQGIWSPVNILGLKMHGAELESVIRYQKHNLSVTLQNFSTWTIARITNNDNMVGNVNGKQLSYVPKWSFKTSLNISSGPLSVFVNQKRIGSRFTTNDHSSSLDPLSAYNIVDSGFILKKDIHNLILSLQGRVMNVFNKSYQVVAWYPMPGRNYTGTISISVKI